ncbi:hypothetical protein [Glaciihabitans tibetensis]|nr:hypothetical protein [Glaciihabitans tibetensis]
MEWVWSLIGIVVTVVLALIAISQSRKYQNRPDLFVTWDRIGLAGGIELKTFASFTIPYMTLTIENHGTAPARLVDLTTTSVVIGTTQETSDGVRPYQQKSVVAVNEPWAVRIPLYKIHESFDHPIEILDPVLMRPTVTLRWKREHGKGMARKVIRLDGDWLTRYADHLRASGN